MTQWLSLFRSVLGPRIDELAPVLRRHYDLGPEQAVLVRGEMDAWNRYPLLRLAAPFMPRPGTSIPVTVINRGTVDEAGQVGMEWRREFHYPDGLVRSVSINLPSPRPLVCASILDAFVTPRGPQLGITLMIEPDKTGMALAQVSVGPQYAMLGRRLLPLPWLARVSVAAVEHALSDDEFYTEVTVSHPVLGRMFGYSGRLRIQ